MRYFNNDEDPDRLSDTRMSLELADSINTLGVRIDELRRIIKRDGRERRTELIKRIECLMDTRMKFIYSFMDLNPHNKESSAFNPFSNLYFSYKDFNHGLNRKPVDE